MIKKIASLMILALIYHNEARPQSRWTIGFDLATRKELRSYHDPKGYLHSQYTPRFAIGGSIMYALNEKLELETGLYETNFNETVSLYYNEPGYRPVMGTGWQVNGMRTLQIPLRLIYSPNISWRKISLNVVGGVNLYNLTHRLSSIAEIGLSPIPVFPTPPTNLFVHYESYPLRKRSLALEGGAEARWELSNRFQLIYRFTGLLGTKAMSRMEGYYETDNPSMKYPFEVSSKGSAIHNTFSLRYRLGRKQQKEKWWEPD